jgi:hydrogenase maturation factor
MCLATYQKVNKVDQNLATLSDGRVVRTDGIPNVKIGDYLEVYADIALSIRSKSENQSVKKVRKGLVK